MTDNVPEDMLSPLGLKRAMKAFKKRLKLMRLDDESSLGGGPFSAGQASSIVAIQPPNQYPREVWDKLVELGRLRQVEGGLYQISQPPQQQQR